MSYSEIESKVETAQDTGHFAEHGVEPSGDSAPAAQAQPSQGMVQEAAAAIASGMAQQSPAQQAPPMQPPPPQFNEWEWNGQKWTPAAFKSPKEWDEFTTQIQQGTLRHADYTRKTQALASKNKQAEEYLSIYGALFDALSNKETFGPTIVNLARKAGAQIPWTEEQHRAIQHDPNHKLSMRLEQLEQKLQQEAEEKQVQAGVEQIFKTWESLKQSLPLLSDRQYSTWIALQSQAGMDPEEAARAIEKDIRRMYSKDHIRTLPQDIRSEMQKDWLTDYLNEKRQANKVRPLAGPGGATMETLATPTPPRGSTPARRRDFIEQQLEGKPAV